MYLLLSNDKDNFMLKYEALRRQEQAKKESAQEKVRLYSNRCFFENDVSDTCIQDTRVTLMGHGSLEKFGTRYEYDSQNQEEKRIHNGFGPEELVNHLINDLKLPTTVKYIDLSGCNVGLTPASGSVNYAEKFAFYLKDKPGYENVQVRAISYKNPEKYEGLITSTDPTLSKHHWDYQARLYTKEQNHLFFQLDSEIKTIEKSIIVLKRRLTISLGTSLLDKDIENQIRSLTSRNDSTSKKNLEDLIKLRELNNTIKTKKSEFKENISNSYLLFEAKSYREALDRPENLISPYTLSLFNLKAEKTKTETAIEGIKKIPSIMRRRNDKVNKLKDQIDSINQQLKNNKEKMEQQESDPEEDDPFVFRESKSDKVASFKNKAGILRSTLNELKEELAETQNEIAGLTNKRSQLPELKSKLTSLEKSIEEASIKEQDFLNRNSNQHKATEKIKSTSAKTTKRTSKKQKTTYTTDTLKTTKTSTTDLSNLEIHAESIPDWKRTKAAVAVGSRGWGKSNENTNTIAEKSTNNTPNPRRFF